MQYTATVQFKDGTEIAYTAQGTGPTAEAATEAAHTALAHQLNSEVEPEDGLEPVTHGEIPTYCVEVGFTYTVAIATA